MKCFILVGGKGERLRPLTENIPKPMVLINGQPFLLYLLNSFKQQGIKEFVFMTGYKAEKIEQFFGDGKMFDVHIEYSYELEPLGTGGALKNAEKFIDEEEILVVNGDSYLDLNCGAMIFFHKKYNSFGTIAIVSTNNCSSYGKVNIDENNIITSFSEKEMSGEGWINAGVYILNKKVLDFFPEGFSSIEKDIFPLLLKTGKVFGFKNKGNFWDIGTIERYQQFSKDMINMKGIIQK